MRMLLLLSLLVSAVSYGMSEQEEWEDGQQTIAATTEQLQDVQNQINNLTKRTNAATLWTQQWITDHQLRLNQLNLNFEVLNNRIHAPWYKYLSYQIAGFCSTAAPLVGGIMTIRNFMTANGLSIPMKLLPLLIGSGIGIGSFAYKWWTLRKYYPLASVEPTRDTKENERIAIAIQKDEKQRAEKVFNTHALFGISTVGVLVLGTQILKEPYKVLRSRLLLSTDLP